MLKDPSQPDLNPPVRLKPLVEFVEIDRRQFFRIAGGALVALSPLSMIGCGGSGGGSGGGGTAPGTMATLKGAVQLPAGTGISMSSLSVGNGMGQQALSSSGAFTVQSHTNGPSVAVVTTANGTGVLMGYMDPTAKSSTISVQSTAVALLCTSLGGSNMPDQVKAQIIAYLNAHPDLIPLVNTLTTRIAANPTAVNDGDAQVTEALNSAMIGICGTTVADAKAGAFSGSVRQGDGTTQMLLNPPSQVSGLQLVQTSKPAEFVANNHWRTPCRLFLYEIATTSNTAPPVTTNLTTAKLIGTPIDLDGKAAILQVNVVQTVKSLISGLFDGTAPLVPVATSPISVPLQPNTTKTQYTLVVMFASANSNVPGFFADPIYAPYTTQWQKTQQDLNIFTFFAKLTIGLFFDVFGVSFTYASFANLKTAIEAMATISDAAWLAMVQSIRFGAIGPKVKLCFELAVENGGTGFVQKGIQQALAPIATLAQQRAVLAAGAAKASVASAALKMVLGAGTLLVGLGDLSATLVDLNNTDYADLWDITVLEPALHLSPPNPTVTPSQTPQQFTVTAPTGTTGTVVWDWSVTAPVGQLTDEAGHQGQSIETSSNAVFLLVTPSDLGHLTLTVEGFVVASGVKTSFGKVSTVVTVVDHLTGTLAAGLSVVSFAPEPGAPDTFAAAMLEFTLNPQGAVFQLSIQGVPYDAIITTEQMTKGGYTKLDPSAPFSASKSARIPGTAFYSLGGNQVGYCPLTGDLNWYTLAFFTNYVQTHFDPKDFALLMDPADLNPADLSKTPGAKTLPKG